MTSHHNFLDLDERARQVFRNIVESYITHGEPVGSRTLSKSFDVSPATIRNVMADLEDLGLLQAPHISAGRLPTDMGLRYFVDGLLEINALGKTERAAIEEECNNANLSMGSILEQVSSTLSGLSACAGLVVAPTQEDKTIRHIEFVPLSQAKAMVILVSDDGTVENRVIDIQPDITPDILRQAGSFLSEKLYGHTIANMRDIILEEIQIREAEIGEMMKGLIESGLATQLSDGKLIVRGRSRLLGDTDAIKNIERVKDLMEQLESKETVSKLLNEASSANGVKIYIGSENSIFEGNGHSLILTPYRGSKDNIVGAIGVIGPTRLNYAKIIPSIDFMAEIISRRIQSLS